MTMQRTNQTLFMLAMAICLFSGGLLFSAVAQEPEARYGAIKALYETKLKEAEETEGKSTRGAQMDYALALEGALSKAQQAGELDDVLAAQKEMEGITTGVFPPVQSLPAYLQPFRTRYETEKQKASTEKQDFLRRLNGSYTAELEKLVVSLTQAGKFDLAKDVKAERELIIANAMAAVAPEEPVDADGPAVLRLATVKMPAFQRMNLEKGARLTLDKEAVFGDVPDEVAGYEFLQTAYDRMNPYTIAVAEAGIVHMLVRDTKDNRALLNEKGWEEVGGKIKVRNPSSTFRLYEKQMAKGAMVVIHPIEEGAYPRLVLAERILVY